MARRGELVAGCLPARVLGVLTAEWRHRGEIAEALGREIFVGDAAADPLRSAFERLTRTGLMESRPCWRDWRFQAEYRRRDVAAR